jgi:NADPH:quinone reductase
MTKLYKLKSQGSIDNLEIINISIPAPASNEVKIKHNFIGVSHMDVHHCLGEYLVDDENFTPGLQATGTITETGDMVNEYQVGDKVVYATCVTGSFAEERNINKNLILKIPDKLDEKLVAATFHSLLASHYLTRRTFKLENKHIVLIHGATGNLAHILCQWIKNNIGSTIIGTVSDPNNLAIAKDFGFDHVVLKHSNDLLNQIRSITNGDMISVVYDSHGKDLYEFNINALSIFGILVNYGDLTGKLNNIDLTLAWNKCNFITKTNLSTYKANRFELVLSATNLFDNLSEKKVIPFINDYKFDEIKKCLKKISTGKNIGANVITL